VLLFLENSKQIGADAIKFAVLRNDAVPIPSSLEAVIRVDETNYKFLKQGNKITVGKDGDVYQIIEAKENQDYRQQGVKPLTTTKIIAILESMVNVSFVSAKAVIKEDAHLGQIYRACGAKISSITDDFQVPRFTCLAGDVPTFHIARIMQENSGIIRYKKKKLQWLRINDIFTQKPVIQVPDNGSEDIKSGFLERNEIPTFFSIDDAGDIAIGDNKKTRSMMFTPNKDAQGLANMTRVLVKRKASVLPYNLTLCAGDLVEVAGRSNMAILTAAHFFSTEKQYTRVWLAEVAN
jgi:hypothetical protein